jgi:pyruvate kinase
VVPLACRRRHRIVRAQNAALRAIRQCDLRDRKPAFPRTGCPRWVRMSAGIGEIGHQRHARRNFQNPMTADSGSNRGDDLLRIATQNCWERPEDRVTRIMVTLPSTARQPSVGPSVDETGMDIARINCAHDDAEGWRSMAACAAGRRGHRAELPRRDGPFRTEAGPARNQGRVVSNSAHAETAGQVTVRHRPG